MAPRGIRNHNPGNLRHGPQWTGLGVAQLDKDFAQFTSAEWGIRALAVLLLNYRKKRGIDTLKELVERYALASENNTTAYAAALSTALGVRSTQQVDWSDPKVMLPLLKAIIRHENGSQPYPDAVIEEGMRRAGIAVPRKET